MVFSIFLLIIFFILVGMVLAKIKIEVKKIVVSNIDKIKLQYDYLVYLKLYAFGFIKFFQIKIDKDRFVKSKMFKNISFSNVNKELRNVRLSPKNINFDVEKFNLNLKVGTESVFLTSLTVIVASTLISAWLNNNTKVFNPSHHYYKVEPLYLDKNLIDLKFKGIITLKMVHIINIIYIVLMKRRGLENARTSNRGVNDDRNEQYPRYDRRKHDYRGTN